MRWMLFWGLFFTSHLLQADYTRDSLGKALLGTALAPTPLPALHVDTSALLISSLPSGFSVHRDLCTYRI